MSEVTRILAAMERGNVKAVDKLFPLVYEELRLLAAQKMSQERPGQTLQPTALVHEAYLRLVGAENQKWEGRRHFFCAAAEAMRRILVENARRKKGQKYGGERQRVALTDADLAVDSPSDDLVALDEALSQLAKEEEIVSRLVELRYFAGFTNKQAAEILGIAPRTADGYWAYARGWLCEKIKERQ
ncbi:MAG: RNA polymerase subunit sigma [Planctomycetota bacterium]|nr:MAG: RNA polymerase subunit sigma [Planctomycetota bacterium]